ncbi:hypothetical protein RHSIM_Rhsim08G0229200 [Rhododendron simsii]|uniref:Uncharacterized protein n=1 Tax=Rhododendron simsii TaxID=118357 RepID=A0A834GMA8_RHOSS|nr:hypothetical protein RHSIM_Rhsim08G0229200 [Rhododendron simsii]
MQHGEEGQNKHHNKSICHRRISEFYDVSDKATLYCRKLVLNWIQRISCWIEEPRMGKSVVAHEAWSFLDLTYLVRFYLSLFLGGSPSFFKKNLARGQQRSLDLNAISESFLVKELKCISKQCVDNFGGTSKNMKSDLVRLALNLNTTIKLLEATVTANRLDMESLNSKLEELHCDSRSLLAALHIGLSHAFLKS